MSFPNPQTVDAAFAAMLTTAKVNPVAASSIPGIATPTATITFNPPIRIWSGLDVHELLARRAAIEKQAQQHVHPNSLSSIMTL